ncbi:hypothetical protein BO443_60026 [Burkholderia orbicola]
MHRACRGRFAPVASRRVPVASVPTDPAEPVAGPLHWPGRCGPAAVRRRVQVDGQSSAQGNPDKWTNFNRFGHS